MCRKKGALKAVSHASDDFFTDRFPLCDIDHEHLQQEDLGKEVFEGDQVVAAFPWSQERESTGLANPPHGKAS